MEVTRINDYEIRLSKAVWSDQELALARCYGLSIQEGSIFCNIKSCVEPALLNMIRLSFQALTTAVHRQTEWKCIQDEISSMYKKMNEKRLEFIQERFPTNTMWEHQKEGVSVSLGRKDTLFAFEVGTGKTLMSASISKVLRIKRTLITCIPVAKWNWLEDLTVKFKFNPLYFSLLDSKQSKTIKAISPHHERFVITHYEALPKHMDYILAVPIGHIIIDEATFIKNHNSNRFKNIQRIIDANPGIKITFLSGTPVKNRVNDLFAYFKLCGHELGKNYARFLREYAQTGKGRSIDRVVGAKNIDSLTLNMANFIMRKKQSDCLDLPPRIYSKVVMEMEDYREEYDRVVQELLEKKDRSPLSSSLMSLNRILAMAKVKGVIEFIDQLIEEGQKIVIFCCNTSPLEMLREHYKDNSVLINGPVQAHERFERVKKFRDDPKCNVFLGDVIAAGTSLNLTVAHHVGFLNFPFTPTDVEQCIGRCHRGGQGDPVHVNFFMCKDTIDEKLYDLVADKQDEVNKIIDGGQGLNYQQDIKDILYKELMHEAV